MSWITVHQTHYALRMRSLSTKRETRKEEFWPTGHSKQQVKVRAAIDRQPGETGTASYFLEKLEGRAASRTCTGQTSHLGLGNKGIT